MTQASRHVAPSQALRQKADHAATLVNIHNGLAGGLRLLEEMRELRGGSTCDDLLYDGFEAQSHALTEAVTDTH